MTRALYAFSGDPITNGHLDIILRAKKSFPDSIVGIGVNPDKKYLFTLEERKDMAEKVLRPYCIKVVSFSGLVVDYAYENNISVIIRGIRSAQDFEYESILHKCGESQKLGIETHILIAKSELAHVSSGAVKAIQKEQGLIHEFVHPYVKQKLEEKISGQIIIGVTGEPAVGKSHLCKQWADMGLPVHNLDLDRLGHDILENLDEPMYESVRQQIGETFGDVFLLGTTKINRRTLGDIVFNNPAELAKLNDIMRTPLMVRIRRAIYGVKGVILFNSALIVESNFAHICNNNIILITADKKVQEQRLLKRGMSDSQIERRLASQYNTEQKRNCIKQIINGHGKLWEYTSSEIVDYNQGWFENNILNYFGVQYES